MKATDDRAPFVCPFCESQEIYRVTGTDGTYECYECGERTHEKVEENRDELRELAGSDNAAASLAATLLGDHGTGR